MLLILSYAKKEDPILLKGDSFSLYTYTGNDPVNFVDINGLFGIEIGIGGLGHIDLLGGGANLNLALTFDIFGDGNLEAGYTYSIQGQAGAGLYGGVSVNFNASTANTLCNLSGGFVGLDSAAGVGARGGNVQLTSGSNSTSIVGSNIGVGLGVAGYGVAGETISKRFIKVNVYNYFRETFIGR